MSKPPAIPFNHPYQDSDMRDVATLRDIMARLRDPVNGCPWDMKQDFASIAPYTIEEAYEVADAIARGDMDDLAEELGDLLLQVIYHAQMAQESRLFDFGDVVQAITTKLVRRHPHVFGDEGPHSAAGVEGLWEKIKAEERAVKAAHKDIQAPPSALDGVAVTLPALTRTRKIQAKAARTGFDWPDATPVIAKVREELDEIEAEFTAGSSQERIEDEMGDILFAAVNLARKAGLDPERALQRANDKFSRRFKAMEQELTACGNSIGSYTLDEMEKVWQNIKKKE